MVCSLNNSTDKTSFFLGWKNSYSLDGCSYFSFFWAKNNPHSVLDDMILAAEVGKREPSENIKLDVVATAGSDLTKFNKASVRATRNRTSRGEAFRWLWSKIWFQNVYLLYRTILLSMILCFTMAAKCKLEEFSILFYDKFIFRKNTLKVFKLMKR